MKLKCEECGKEYQLEKGENPSDYQCVCGGKLKPLFDFRKNRVSKPSAGTQTNHKGGIVDQLLDFWEKQGTPGKVGIGVGVCCLGILLIGVFGLLTGDAGMSEEDLKANAIQVTAADLYNDRGDLVDKPVKMTAEVLQPGDDTMRVCGIAIDQYGFNDAMDQDILIEGDFSDLTIYENDEVHVYGIFKGQTSYQTVLGDDRKVPLIDNALVIPTGKSYKI